MESKNHLKSAFTHANNTKHPDNATKPSRAAHISISNVYSRINQLPSGIADCKPVPGCIVLEGGAFRGVYGEGVLDALMQNDLLFSCTIGVSAGALNGLNYVAGNIGRSARTNLRYRHDSRYVGLTALQHNHGVIGFDFVLDQLNQTDPLNQELFWNPDRRFLAVATDCQTGKPAYFEKGVCSDIFKAIQASASMPYISRMVMIDGIPYLDGGCSKNIPYEWALEQDFSKIIIIRTRPADFRKPAKVSKTALRHYRNYPSFATALSQSNLEYNRECEELNRLSQEGRIFMISPSHPVSVGRLEKDMEKLGALYYMGYRDGLRAISELNAYLER